MSLLSNPSGISEFGVDLTPQIQFSQDSFLQLKKWAESQNFDVF